MKKKINAVLLMTTIIFSLTMLVSCEEDPPPADTSYTISGAAAGSQEVPPVSTTANGTLTGTYNSANNTLQYSITWSGLSGTVTAMHFHGPALAGIIAPPIHNITSQIITNGSSGSAGGTVLLHDSTENHLLNGRIYYNIHTGANANGEIRGQVTATQ